MATQSQTEFKTVMDQAEAIRTKAEAMKTWTKEDQDSYQKCLNRADELKLLIETEKHADELKGWAKEGNGIGVAAKLGFMRPAGPNEGAANLTGSQNQDDADADTDTGKRLRDLMSTKRYNRAYEDYVRAQCKAMAFGGDSKAHMAESSLKVMQEGIDIAGKVNCPFQQ